MTTGKALDNSQVTSAFIATAALTGRILFFAHSIMTNCKTQKADSSQVQTVVECPRQRSLAAALRIRCWHCIHDSTLFAVPGPMPSESMAMNATKLEKVYRLLQNR